MRTISPLLGLACITLLLGSMLRGHAQEPHWSFVSPTQAAIPATSHPIDYFVSAKLKETGLAPAPRAPKHTLIRRLSQDLRGLPPTPEEVTEFLGDDSPDAWNKLIERFLASPHFGERLAQNWLDLARYADTSGYAADRTRNMWVYRDWVINSINRNQPFDQFTIEQIAGDLLPGSTVEQKVATGFHRNAQQAKGNNPRKEEFRVKTVVDRLKTTGRTWLGLTLECAECHDHKHDPISQKEYYELFAIFNNVPHLGSGYGTHGPLIDYTPSRQKDPSLQKLLAETRANLPPAKSPEHKSLLGNWTEPVIDDDPKFSVTGDLTITARIQTTQRVANIASKYDWKAQRRSYVFGIGGEGDKNGVPGHLFAWISAKSASWAGAEIVGSRPVNDGKEHHVAIVFKAGQSMKLFIDGVEDTKARIMGSVPGSIAECDRALAIGAGYTNSTTPDDFKFTSGLKNVRLYSSALGDPGRTGKAGLEVAALERKLNRVAAKPIKIHVMDELSEPRVTHIHVRGNYKDKGERVSANVPQVLPPLAFFSEIPRLKFARWLAQPGHPLTARVATNYLWQHFFGTGLVATPADFGAQGAAPSHPELLDWLAVEFAKQGWDRKALVRLIVTSQAYQRSSHLSADLRQRDPNNQLLARMTRQRLPGEQIRDRALAVSGLLVPEVGGPPVFPTQPKGLYEERGQNEPGNSNFTWKDSPGEGRYRKSMYTYWKRMMLHPTLSTFDAPPRQECTAKRSLTNTSRQALVTLNDPIFHECAQALAKRITEAHKTTRERINLAFLLGLSRPPTASELKQFSAFADSGDENAWLSVASVLLNLDESLTRE